MTGFELRTFLLSQITALTSQPHSNVMTTNLFLVDRGGEQDHP